MIAPRSLAIAGLAGHDPPGKVSQQPRRLAADDIAFSNAFLHLDRGPLSDSQRDLVPIESSRSFLTAT